MKLLPIFVTLDNNEAMRPRAEKIEYAVEADDRFFLANPGELPFDLRFSLTEELAGIDPHVEIHEFHIELKDFTGDHQSDYLSSILNGHLWEQVQTAKELGRPFAIVVLGDDNDVAQAVAKAVFSRGFKGKEAADKIYEYSAMVDGFEANCIGEHIPVWRLKDNPYKRLLLRVRKILQGGDLTGFAPAPAEGERQAVGLSILAGRGIGVTKANSILLKFYVALKPKLPDIYLTDCDGIGKKLALQVAQSGICVPCDHVCRPPKPRKSRAKAAKLAEVLG